MKNERQCLVSNGYQNRVTTDRVRSGRSTICVKRPHAETRRPSTGLEERMGVDALKRTEIN